MGAEGTADHNLVASRVNTRHAAHKSKFLELFNRRGEHAEIGWRQSVLNLHRDLRETVTQAARACEELESQGTKSPSATAIIEELKAEQAAMQELYGAVDKLHGLPDEAIKRNEIAPSVLLAVVKVQSEVMSEQKQALATAKREVETARLVPIGGASAGEKGAPGGGTAPSLIQRETGEYVAQGNLTTLGGMPRSPVAPIGRIFDDEVDASGDGGPVRLYDDDEDISASVDGGPGTSAGAAAGIAILAAKKANRGRIGLFTLKELTAAFSDKRGVLQWANLDQFTSALGQLNIHNTSVAKRLFDAFDSVGDGRDDDVSVRRVLSAFSLLAKGTLEKKLEYALEIIAVSSGTPGELPNTDAAAVFFLVGSGALRTICKAVGRKVRDAEKIFPGCDDFISKLDSFGHKMVPPINVTHLAREISGDKSAQVYYHAAMYNLYFAVKMSKGIMDQDISLGSSGKARPIPNMHPGPAERKRRYTGVRSDVQDFVYAVPVAASQPSEATSIAEMEWVMHLKKLGMNPFFAERLFKALDKRRAGVIDRDNLVNGLADVVETSTRKLEVAFNAYDLNRNGTVGPDEIARFVFGKHRVKEKPPKGGDSPRTSKRRKDAVKEAAVLEKGFAKFDGGIGRQSLAQFKQWVYEDSAPVAWVTSFVESILEYVQKESGAEPAPRAKDGTAPPKSAPPPPKGPVVLNYGFLELSDVSLDELVQAFPFDKSGRVDFSRFQAGVRNLGIRPARTYQLYRFFLALDKNRSASVDRKEIRSGIEALVSREVENKIQYAFRAYDEKGTGSITAANVRAFIRSESSEWPDEKPSQRDADKAENLHRNFAKYCSSPNGMGIAEFRRWALEDSQVLGWMNDYYLPNSGAVAAVKSGAEALFKLFLRGEKELNLPMWKAGMEKYTGANRTQASGLFNALDINNTKVIEKKEFVDFIQSLAGADKTVLSDIAFRVFDIDRSKVISKGKMMQVFSPICLSPPPLENAKLGGSPVSEVAKKEAQVAFYEPNRDPTAPELVRYVQQMAMAAINKSQVVRNVWLTNTLGNNGLKVDVGSMTKHVWSPPPNSEGLVTMEAIQKFLHGAAGVGPAIGEQVFHAMAAAAHYTQSKGAAQPQPQSIKISGLLAKSYLALICAGTVEARLDASFKYWFKQYHATGQSKSTAKAPRGDSDGGIVDDVDDESGAHADELNVQGHVTVKVFADYLMDAMGATISMITAASTAGRAYQAISRAFPTQQDDAKINLVSFRSWVGIDPTPITWLQRIAVKLEKAIRAAENDPNAQGDTGGAYDKRREYWMHGLGGFRRARDVVKFEAVASTGMVAKLSKQIRPDNLGSDALCGCLERMLPMKGGKELWRKAVEHASETAKIGDWHGRAVTSAIVWLSSGTVVYKSHLCLGMAEERLVEGANREELEHILMGMLVLAPLLAESVALSALEQDDVNTRSVEAKLADLDWHVWGDAEFKDVPKVSAARAFTFANVDDTLGAEKAKIRGEELVSFVLQDPYLRAWLNAFAGEWSDQPQSTLKSLSRLPLFEPATATRVRAFGRAIRDSVDVHGKLEDLTKAATSAKSAVQVKSSTFRQWAEVFKIRLEDSLLDDLFRTMDTDRAGTSRGVLDSKELIAGMSALITARGSEKAALVFEQFSSGRSKGISGEPEVAADREGLISFLSAWLSTTTAVMVFLVNNAADVLMRTRPDDRSVGAFYVRVLQAIQVELAAKGSIEGLAGRVYDMFGDPKAKVPFSYVWKVVTADIRYLYWRDFVSAPFEE